MMSDISTPNVSITPKQACEVIDHIVDAMAYHSSCPIRRAIILTDIHTHPNTSQASIRERIDLDIGKSALNRDIDWMYNYGVIRRQESTKDARKVTLTVSEYSKEHVQKALKLFQNSEKSLQNFLKGLINILRDDKSALREAKIIAKINESGTISKQEVLESLYNGSAATASRAFSKLVEEGLIEDVDG